MKLAIMSDSHDNWANLSKAIEIANSEKCEHLLFAGDLISPPGLDLFESFNGQVHFVWGNNEGEKMKLTQKIDASKKITLYDRIYEGAIDGSKIFMNHYPRPSELAAKTGEFNLVISGHTHIYREDKIGNTLHLNPGEIQGYLSGQATFVIFDIQTQKHQKIVIA